MRISGLHRCSLDPPALSGDAGAAAQEKLTHVLLEARAYVAKRDNATTAFSKTCDGKEIQVTLCTRRPPLVSYLSVHSPDAAEINVEPAILATEDEFVLLRVAVGAKGDILTNTDYYVYQADGADGPSLEHLPRPPSGCFFDSSNIGILGYNPDDDNQSGFFLRPHRVDTAYIVVGLHRAHYSQPYGQFDLCLYDSKQGIWKIIGVSLSQEEQEQHGGEDFCHLNSKVMAIRDSGTMAFVDLWRGIIFCDVLSAKDKPTNPELHYIKLPKPLQRNKTLQGDARVYRDIAVIGNRLKYVELQLYYKASVVIEGQYIRDGWMAATWSRLATSSSTEGWHEDNRVMDSDDLKVDRDMYFKLLPKIYNDEGATLAPFLRLDVCQPVLGIDDGKDIIYFTAKRKRGDASGWVVTVDLEKKELLGVAFFAYHRYIGINFAYMHSRISEYLNNDPGVEGSKQWEETALPGSECFN